MTRLTKADVRGATLVLQEDEVEIPELGGSVLIRQLTAGARTRLLDGIVDLDSGAVTDLPLFQARMFAASIIDPEFTEEEATEILDSWPSPVWDRVMARVGAMTPNPQEVERAAAQEFRGTDERPTVSVSPGGSVEDDSRPTGDSDERSRADVLEGAGLGRGG